MNSVVVRKVKERPQVDRVGSTGWARTVPGALLVLCVFLGGCGIARPSRPSVAPGGPRASVVVRLRLSGASAALARRLHVEVCSEVWIGPRTGGSWGTSREWSGGRVPDKRDMACVRRGVMIALSGGHYVVGSLIDGGATIITHGALLIADPRVVSQFAVMRVTDGRLTWAGVVDGGTLDASRGSDIVSGTPAGAAPQRRLLACLPGYTPQTTDSDCGPRFDTPPDAQTLRTVWSEFATRVNLAAAIPALAQRWQGVIGAMLRTSGCRPSINSSVGATRPVPQPCDAAIHHVIAAAIQRRLSTRLTGVTISGHRASAHARGTSGVQFVATRDDWWISSIALDAQAARAHREP